MEKPAQVELLVPASANINKGGADLQSIADLHLFGKPGLETPVPAPVQPVVKTTDAKQTRLQLSLMGILQGTESQWAIIEYQRKQGLYKVGDELPVGNNVSLAKVLDEKVLINNRGSLESVPLYTEEKMKNSSARAANLTQKQAPQVVDNRANRNVSAMASKYRQQLMKNPASLADVIRVSMNRDPQTGQLNGYRVRPGRHRDAFNDFGFKPNDVVTAINGIELNDPSRTMEVYKMLRSASEANFSVLRNGQSITLMVSLGEGAGQ